MNFIYLFTILSCLDLGLTCNRATNFPSADKIWKSEFPEFPDAVQKFPWELETNTIFTEKNDILRHDILKDDTSDTSLESNNEDIYHEIMNENPRSLPSELKTATGDDGAIDSDSSSSESSEDELDDLVEGFANGKDLDMLKLHAKVLIARITGSLSETGIFKGKQGAHNSVTGDASPLTHEAKAKVAAIIQAQAKAAAIIQAKAAAEAKPKAAVMIQALAKASAEADVEPVEIAGGKREFATGDDGAIDSDSSSSESSEDELDDGQESRSFTFGFPLSERFEAIIQAQAKAAAIIQAKAEAKAAAEADVEPAEIAGGKREFVSDGQESGSFTFGGPLSGRFKVDASASSTLKRKAPDRVRAVGTDKKTPKKLKRGPYERWTVNQARFIEDFYEENNIISTIGHESPSARKISNYIPLLLTSCRSSGFFEDLLKNEANLTQRLTNKLYSLKSSNRFK